MIRIAAFSKGSVWKFSRIVHDNVYGRNLRSLQERRKKKTAIDCTEKKHTHTPRRHGLRTVSSRRYGHHHHHRNSFLFIGFYGRMNLFDDSSIPFNFCCAGVRCGKVPSSLSLSRASYLYTFSIGHIWCRTGTGAASYCRWTHLKSPEKWQSSTSHHQHASIGIV